MQQNDAAGSASQVEIENARKEGYRAGYKSGYIDGEVMESKRHHRIGARV